MQFAKYQEKAFNKIRDEINEIMVNDTDILAKEQAESTMNNSMNKTLETTGHATEQNFQQISDIMQVEMHKLVNVQMPILRNK